MQGGGGIVCCVSSRKKILILFFHQTLGNNTEHCVKLKYSSDKIYLETRGRRSHSGPKVIILCIGQKVSFEWTFQNCFTSLKCKFLWIWLAHFLISTQCGGGWGVRGFQSLVWQGKKLIGARERLSLADYQKSLISTTTLHTARW